MILRPYQLEAVAAVKEAWREHQSTMVVMPTGVGKTVVAASLMAEQRGRSMFLVHRSELADQAIRAAWAFDLSADREQGLERADGQSLWSEKSQVVVSTVQTQISGQNGSRRMHRFDPMDFSLLVVDENHHSPSKSWSETIKYYRDGNPNLRVLGQTATPDRSDELALGKMFESVAYVYEIEDAIDNGWLVGVEQIPVTDVEIDYSGIRKTAGDLNGKDLARVLEREEVLQGIADATRREAAGRQTLVFTVRVEQAKLIAEILNRKDNGCARYVSGKTPDDERRRIIREFQRREYQFLVNVGVATEGFDCPSVEVIAMARPTLSRALYAQCVGRGLRPLPGLVDGVEAAADRRQAIASSEKKICTVLDFVGNSGRHKLASCADILGGRYSDEEIELANRKASEGGQRNPREDLDDARRELIEQKKRDEDEAARRRAHVVGKARYKTGARVDPFGVLGIGPERSYGWGKNPATDKQIAFLDRAGIPTADVDKGMASRLIGEVMERRGKGLATFKQIKHLKRMGVDTKGMTMREASAILDERWGNKTAKKPEAPVASRIEPGDVPF